MTAQEWIASEYGTMRFARTISIDDIQSVLYLMDEYAKYVVIYLSEQNKGANKPQPQS